MIETNAWEDHGGQSYRMTSYGDLLSITALHRNHIAIADLLEQLRANPDSFGNPKQ
jgi:hypothetical protein